MDVFDATGIEDWSSHCIVCVKSVEGGGGFCKLNIDGQMVALCCPLCLETFQKKPDYYMALRYANFVPKKRRPS